MPNLFKRAAPLCALSLWLAACSSTPEVRFYQLAPGGEDRDASGRVVLGVDPLEANIAYEDPRIVYRTSPYRIDYYYYHRWAAPPGMMVTDVLRDALTRSGRFAAVTSGFDDNADAVLRGRLIALEEVDVDRDQWLGRITLDLELVDARSGAVLWSGTLTEERPVAEREPEGVARALSEAVDAIAARVSKQALVHAVEKPSAAR